MSETDIVNEAVTSFAGGHAWFWSCEVSIQIAAEIAAGNDLMKRTYSKYFITRKENTSKCKQACIQHIYAIFLLN
jgi:hypothetical protein